MSGRNLRRRSFVGCLLDACRGVFAAVQSEWNMKVHLAMSGAVIVVGVVLNVDRYDWCLLILSISLVLSLELLNTSLEKALDRLAPEEHPLTGLAKDTAAASVLMAACGAASVGLLVFVPHLFSLMEKG